MVEPVVRKFNDRRVELLQKQVQSEGREYEVFVDGFKVTWRTSDTEKFFDFEDEIDGTVSELSFLVYSGQSNRNRKYTFLMNVPEIAPPVPVNGLGSLGDVEQRFEQRLNERDKDYELSRLKEKLEDTQEKLGFAEERIEVLDKEIDMLRDEKEANKFNMGGVNIVELGSALIRSTIYAHAPKNTAAATLAGVLGALNPPTPMETIPEVFSENTFRDHVEQPQYAPEQLALLQTIQKAQGTVSVPQLKQVNGILSCLLAQPSQIVTVADLLNIKM
jgi:hypothetical protein